MMDQGTALQQVEDFAEEAEAAVLPVTPYWLKPVFLVSCTLGIPALVTWYLPNEVFVKQWNCAKYFDGRDVLQIALGILCFALGSSVWSVFRSVLRQEGFQIGMGDRASTSPFFRVAYFFSAFLTLFGSAIWTAFAFKKGITIGDALSALHGSADAVVRIRQQAETIAGVTTLTQFGMAAGVLAGILWYRSRSRSIRWSFYLVVLVAFLRAFMRAERLALIEVVVPFGVSILPELLREWRGKRLFRLAVKTMPVLAVCGLMGFFIIAEMGRSYSAKLESGLDEGPIYYGAVRIGGYYGTSLNNGAYLADRLPHAQFPFFAFDWLWRFPGVSYIISPRDITGMDGSEVGNLLDADLNMEFNNPSGFFCYQHDFGKFGVMFAAFLAGIAAGRIFISFRNRSNTGRLLYPMVVLGLLEIARIPYLSGGRAFPSLFILLTLVLLDRAVQYSAVQEEYA